MKNVLARLTKIKIRSKILLRLSIQKEEERVRKSSQIKRKLLRTKEFIRAKTVMFYIPLQGEVDTREMIKKAIKLGKKIAVPVCRKNRTIMLPALLSSHAKLKIGPYGVKEPAVQRCLSLKELDLVIVPGLAFDKKGNRLGRGKGYYDRFLSLLPDHARSIGLAFDFQILPSVTTLAHDVGVHKILYA